MIPGEELLFCALGGSGEIGMNVNLYGCQGQWLMVDLGLTFADIHYPGIDLILPELEFIEQQQDGLRDHPHPRPRGPYRCLAVSGRGSEGAALRHSLHRRTHRRRSSRKRG
jgi:hypothetical protein